MDEIVNATPPEDTIYGRYTFDEKEKKEVASGLATAIQEKERLTDELKSLKSSFKSQVDHVQAKINQLSTNYSLGYEMRQVRCQVVINRTTHEKLYYNTETGELVRAEKATEKDL